MKNIIENKLRSRNTEDLKTDIITAMNSDDDGANIIFCLGLNVLEERLNEDEYEAFENSL